MLHIGIGIGMSSGRASAPPAYAGGWLEFGVNPSDGDALPALNGYGFINFRGDVSGFPRIGIQSTLADTLSVLASATQARTGDVEELAGATYTATATRLIITYDTPKPDGLDYTLGASTPNITRSGATLT